MISSIPFGKAYGNSETITVQIFVKCSHEARKVSIEGDEMEIELPRNERSYKLF